MNRFILLLILLSSAAIAGATASPAKKHLDIKVISSGAVYMWPDTINSIELSAVVQERLWKSYLGTGKMYDDIRITYETGVNENQKAAALKAIKEGQAKALIDICLQKNKKRYEELSPRQQKKIRHQFPVLFQNFD